VGAVLGPIAGGAGISSGGDRAPLWCSAVLVACALVVAGTARVATRAPQARTAVR
jgi:DHA1 family chloramphenicol resistance protein-like MFS transporter